MRRLGLSLLFLAAMVLCAPASATTLEALLAELEAQGYHEIEISRTWLGRIRIEAESATHERELILDRGSLEILRDYAEPQDGDDDDADKAAPGHWLLDFD
ncbi:hypothetical protein N6L24_10620 [Cognatishimia sp. SS12]|uniref:hypothetical protein n=1 Tax=Cognatishimia sp. SS12 TaxID=2979465 RepID=UPI00232D159C|nr:hypothetical protein [Cognatishimia sp. SS12]MDC0738734.1 hypothetical protein [Cognatishimia sp. SS12]